jgi:hypothetical protein
MPQSAFIPKYFSTAGAGFRVDGFLVTNPGTDLKQIAAIASQAFSKCARAAFGYF